MAQKILAGPRILYSAFLMLSLSISPSIFAAGAVVDPAKIAFVAVAGGADSSVSNGVSCITVTGAVPASCGGGFVAIQNSNKQLLLAALTAQASHRDIWLYLEMGTVGTNYHCPGVALTPCSVISIMLK